MLMALSMLWASFPCNKISQFIVTKRATSYPDEWLLYGLGITCPLVGGASGAIFAMVTGNIGRPAVLTGFMVGAGFFLVISLSVVGYHVASQEA
jgi:hypothetical protein